MHPFGSELTPVYYHSLFLSSQRDILLKVWRMHRVERGRRKAKRDTCGRYCSRFCWRDEPSNLAVSQGVGEEAWEIERLWAVRPRKRILGSEDGKEGEKRFLPEVKSFERKGYTSAPTTDLSYTPTSPTATGVPPLFSPSECFFRQHFSPPNFEIFRFVDLPLQEREEEGRRFKSFWCSRVFF